MLARLVISQVTTLPHISANMDVTSQVPVYGRKFLRCLAARPLPSGLAASPSRISLLRVDKANLAWLPSRRTELLSLQTPTSTTCRQCTAKYRLLTTLPRAAPRLLLIPRAPSKTPLSSLQLHCRPLPATLPAGAWTLALVVNLTRRPPIRLPSSGRFSTRLVLFSVQLEEPVIQFLAVVRRGSMVWYPRAIPLPYFLLQ
jgi:hypothetical protein